MMLAAAALIAARVSGSAMVDPAAATLLWLVAVVMIAVAIEVRP